MANPSTLLPLHWAELQRSAIAADVAAANVASWGPGTDRHWEAERAELVAYARLQLQTESKTASGLPQAQPGFLADRLIRLDQRYRHLAAGGWRSLSDALPGLEAFDQWKPADPRQKGERNGRGQWVPLFDQHGRPVPIKYEAPPKAPDGGGLLLPRVPLRCWELIADRQGLPHPDAAAQAAGFWPWALAHPSLELLLTEGWKKSLAAVSAGWAAVAVPGITMGWRTPEGGEARLIEALQLLAPGRRWRIAFDAEAKPTTATKVAAAAGALARALRSAGGRVEVARLPLLPRHDKTGLDDLLAAAGPEALDRALATTGPRAVLPTLRPADRIAPAGQWLGVAQPIPSPELAPLVVLATSMGAGKTEAIAAAVAPLQAVGIPLLPLSHRVALGRALAERFGVAWAPLPGSDERLLGGGLCLDSCCPSSGLQISGHSWSGAVVALDELGQQLEHLLLSNGTALAHRRAEVLRTLAELLGRSTQVIGADAQLADWAVALLERLTGRRALVIASEHRPMAGRALHCPEGFGTPKDAAQAFRAKWAELVAAGDSFLCWTSAQRAESKNAPQNLAALHRQRRPADLVDAIDSTTPELAAELAADPDGFAERRTAQALAQGGSWALYCSPSISSGISWSRWRPAAVIALAGGHIAPEHPAQAMARVRCPEVRGWLFAPERCPGDGAGRGGLRVGSGATNPAQLIADLRAVADPLLGQLEGGDNCGAWLAAWAELGATRNRQRFAYRASISGLLEREGWELQAPGPEPCPAAGAQATADLQAIAEAALAAEDQALIAADPLTDKEAAELARRRQLEPSERAALQRYRLAQRWALGAADPTPELLEADRAGLADRLRLGWLLSTPEALALVPNHDQQRIAALDPAGRPFAPDRLRVAIAPRLAAMQALGVPELVARFAAGETIAATDPAVVALHATATAHRSQLAAAAGCSPGVKATGTLRALLLACGWRLERAGRIKARGAGRDAYTYRAERLALPEVVSADALAAAWLAALEGPAGGAFFVPIQNPYRGEKSPTPAPPPLPPPIWLDLQARAVAIPWPPAPPRCRQEAPAHAA